jgi:hypothetical protein
VRVGVGVGVGVECRVGVGVGAEIREGGLVVSRDVWQTTAVM